MARRATCARLISRPCSPNSILRRNWSPLRSTTILSAPGSAPGRRSPKATGWKSLRRVRGAEMNEAASGDPLRFYDVELRSRLLVGTAQYPSPAILAEALDASRAEVVTVSLRREAGGGRAGESFWGLIRSLGVRVLPN